MSVAASSGKPRRTPMERAPSVDLGSQLIPKERYLDPDFARLEWARMWTRVWLMAGLECDIPEPGDYLTFEIGHESILIIRQETGEISARFNVCTHRGNRLRNPGMGHASSFSCTFHGWRFGLDGSLLRVHDPESFPQGCPIQELSLRSVRCETWGGFVWINLNPDAESLRDYLGIVPEHLDPYHFEQMKILDNLTVEVPCNWKISVDAFNEAYHMAATHPDTLPFSDDVNVPIDCYERHTRMIMPLGVASPRDPGFGMVTEGVRENFLRRYGVDPDHFEGGAEDVRPSIANSVRENFAPGLGADFSELRDEQLVDDFHYTIFPNITFNIFGMNAWLFRHRPHPTDPSRMYFDFFDLLRSPGRDVPRPQHRTVILNDDLEIELVGGGGGLLAQDWWNLPRVQQGMRSEGFRGLHLGDQEVRIRHFHDILGRYIGSE